MCDYGLIDSKGRQIARPDLRFLLLKGLGALIGATFVITCLCSGTAAAQSPREQLNQLVQQLHQKPDDNALRERVIKLASHLKPQPAIPEEARRHFVKAVTLQKDAQKPEDYDLPINEYQQALLLAPWGSDAYFDLASALELKQQYPVAIQNLRLAMLANPGGSDARTAQDKIYALEAKQEKLQKAALAQDVAARAEEENKRAYQSKIGFLGGPWICRVEFAAPNGQPMSRDFKATVAIAGRLIAITNADDRGNRPFVRGAMETEDYTSIRWMAADDSDDTDSKGKVWSPAPDLAINVVVDKARSQIHWQQPQLMLDYQSGASWTTQFGQQRYTLSHQ